MRVTMLVSMPVLVRMFLHRLYSTGLLAPAQPVVQLAVIGKYDNNTPRIR